MLLLDVVVVVAASRDDHPLFAVARPWLDGVLADGSDFAVPDVVAASYLRLVTHRRVFEVPTPLPDAFAFLDALAAQAAHVPLRPGVRHRALLRAACEEAGATGDLVPDAVLAALAREHDAQVVTFDRDLARFPSVRHHLLRT